MSERTDSDAHVWLVTSNYVVAAQGAVSGPLVARMLGPGGRGQTAALLTAAFLAATLASLGLGAALTGRASAYKIGVLAAATRTFRPYVMVLSLLILPVLYFVGREVSVAPISLLLIVAVPAVLGNFSVGIRMGILTAAGRYKQVLIAKSVAAAALILSLIIVPILGGGVIAVIGVYLTCSVIPGLWPLGGKTDRVLRSDISLARQVLRQDVPALTAQSLLNVSNARADQAILPLALNNRDLGFYSVGVTYSSLTGPLNAAVAVIIMRRMGRGKEISTTFPWRVVLVLLVASMLLAANAFWVIPLMFGKAYESAVVPSIILCLVSIVTGVSTILAGMLIAAGRSSKIIVGELMTLALLPLTLPASSMYGPTGASVAAAFSYFANFIYLIVTAIATQTVRSGSRKLGTSRDNKH